VGQLGARERLLADVRQALEGCSDIERITARVCCRRALLMLVR